MFAKAKQPVKLRRRDKRVKRHLRVIERFHSWKTTKAYDEYYDGAIF